MTKSDLPVGLEAGATTAFDLFEDPEDGAFAVLLFSIAISQQRIAGELYSTNEALRRIADSLESR